MNDYCVVLSPSMRRADWLMREFLEQVGGIRTGLYTVKDDDGYTIMFRSDQIREHLLGLRPDYFIEEYDFMKMWCIE